MTRTYDVAAIVGSLRRDSYTRRLVQACAALAPAGLDLTIVEIGALPLYNPDAEAGAPVAWLEFRARIRRADAVLFATPEYNRSIPGALKNALDVGSRPYGGSAWAGKPCAVLSASPGAMGGFGANHHLRQCLVFLDMPTLQQPEAYLGGADKILDAAGGFVNPATRDFCAKFLQSFARWIERNAPA